MFGDGNSRTGIPEERSFFTPYAILFVAIKAIELLKVAFKEYET